MKQTLARILESDGIRWGVASGERLGSVPSMDPEYLLPGAKSVISLAHVIDGDAIRRYLGKEDRNSYPIEEAEITRALFTRAHEAARFLESEGHRAVVVMPNGDYRYKDDGPDIPLFIVRAIITWLMSESGPGITTLKESLVRKLYPAAFGGVDWNLTPTFSHRYGAVAAGVGAFGWSGNVMAPEFGSRVLLETVITDAELSPDDMLEETPCDGCRICTKVCQAGYMTTKEKDSVRIGGVTHVHNRKRSNIRCSIVCAGFTGQNLYDDWSTWSPGRFTLPETDEHIREFFDRFVMKTLTTNDWYARAVRSLALGTEAGYMDTVPPEDKVRATCGNCQLVCWADRREREYNYELLTGSGRVVEGKDGSLEVIRD